MIRSRARLDLLVLWLFIPVLATCGGGSDGAEPIPTRLVVALVPPSTIANGVAFPLEFQVAAADGDPVAVSGVPITVAVSGGRTLGGTVTLESDADGAAQFEGLSITGATGIVQITATAPELTPVTTGNITLSAGAPSSLTVIAGDSQSVQVANAVPAALQVRVQDAAGNTVAGAGVTLLITAGAGSLHADSAGVLSRSVVANESGVATLGVWRMGTTKGANHLAVSVSGHPEVPTATLTATGTPGPFYSFTYTNLLASPPRLDSTYAAPLRVKAADSYGNGLAGIPVALGLRGPSGNPIAGLAGASGSTDSAGHFFPGPWTVGTLSGVYAFTMGGVAQSWVEVPPGPFTRVIAVDTEVDRLRNSVAEVEFRTVDRHGNGVPLIHVEGMIVSGGGNFAVGGESQELGLYKPTLTAPATAGNVILKVWSPTIPDSAGLLTVHVRAPVALQSVGPDSQTVVVGDSLLLPFLVKAVDADGNGVPGVPMGTSALVPGSVVTDSNGIAAITPLLSIDVYRTIVFMTSTWVLADTLQWPLRSIAGPAHHLEVICCAVPSGEVADTITSGPEVIVRDRLTFRVPGVSVHFAPAHGSILGADVVSDSLGSAIPTGIILDTIAGLVGITASATGTDPVIVNVRALPGPTNALTALPGPGPEGFAGERLALGVFVEGKDRYGNPATGRTVSRAVLSGGGSVTAGTLTLDTLGHGYADGWILGPGVGGQDLRLHSDSADLDFTATARTPSSFNIVLRGVPAAHDGVFRRAAYGWRRRIVGDIADITLSSPIGAGQCAPFQQTLSGTVDDVVIDVSIGEIDGPGGILGGAGPCFIRTVGSLPLLGAMQFDDTDLAALLAEGTLGDVILHEMGHVLGIGSLWSQFGVIVNKGTTNPRYSGTGGKAGWVAIGGVGATGDSTVPIENIGGAGTADAHWRESIMPSELMTGYLSAAVNPMSIVTVQSLLDLGYSVDLSTADPYTVMTAPRRAPGQAPIRIRDVVAPPRFGVTPGGTVTPLE